MNNTEYFLETILDPFDETNKDTLNDYKILEKFYNTSSNPSYNKSTMEKKGQYFYNRSDYLDILAQLSPLRISIEIFIPYLHYLGLITNLLCVLILIQKKMINRKSIFYLVFLAFSDFMYNFLAELPNFLKRVKLVDYDIFKISDLSCFFYDYRTATFHFYSVLITLFVTIDRFDHIHRPLKLNRRFINVKSKLFVGVGLFLVSLIIALPHGLLMVYSEVEKDCDARSFFRKRVANTTLTNYQLYFTFTEPVIIWFVPGLVILCLNFYVIVKIYKSKNNGKKRLGIRVKFCTCNDPNEPTLSFFPEKSTRFSKSSTKRKSSTTLLSKLNITIYNSTNNEVNIFTRKNSYNSATRKTSRFSNNLELKNGSGKSTNSSITGANDIGINGNNRLVFKKLSDVHLSNENIPLNNMNISNIYVRKNSIVNGSVNNLCKMRERTSSIFKSKPYSLLNISSAGIKNDLICPNCNRVVMANSLRNDYLKNLKLNFNKITHYITIITVGFYFIISTTTFGIMLSIQNNLTLKLNYELNTKEDYFRDPLWIKYGHLRDWVIVGKLFFISNHCFNFILYFLFNRLFRLTFYDLLTKFKRSFKFTKL